MNALERVPEQEKVPDMPESIEAALESLEGQGSTYELSAMSHALRAREVIANTVPSSAAEQETLTALKERIKEKTDEAIKDLQRALQAAVLAMALSAAPLEAGAHENPPPVSAEALVENPKLAEDLLRGVLQAAARTESSATAAVVSEANSALEKLQEPQGKKYGKLALSIAEHAARALASAAGLGLGVAGYDILKEIVKTARGKGG